MMFGLEGFSFRSGEIGDIASIVHLLVTHGATDVNDSALVDSLRRYASVVVEHEGSLIGFGYCNPVAADVMGLAGLMVHSEHRGVGVGSSILYRLKKQVSDDYFALMVILDSGKNKELFLSQESALLFFYRNDFKSVAASPATDVLWCRFI